MEWLLLCNFYSYEENSLRQLYNHSLGTAERVIEYFTL